MVQEAWYLQVSKLYNVSDCHVSQIQSILEGISKRLWHCAFQMAKSPEAPCRLRSYDMHVSANKAAPSGSKRAEYRATLYPDARYLPSRGRWRCVPDVPRFLCLCRIGKRVWPWQQLDECRMAAEISSRLGQALAEAVAWHATGRNARPSGLSSCSHKEFVRYKCPAG